MRKTDRAFRYLIAALTTLGLLGMTPAVSGKQPNILLVMADDMGWTDIGSFGSEIETPNLDALAQQGVKFTDLNNRGNRATRAT
jgi:arylsulfatase